MKTHLTAIALLLLAGTASARDFVPVPGEGQRLEYDKGNAVLFFYGADFGGLVTFEPVNKKRAWLRFGFRNNGQSSFNISERAITATGIDGKPLQVYTYAQLAKEEKRRQGWAAFGAGLAAAGNNMNAQQAGNTTYSGTYSGNSRATAYGPYGTATATGTSYGTYSGQVYDPGAAAQAQRQADERNQAIFERQRQNAAQGQATLEGRALRANTLDPEEAAFGDVMVALPKRVRGKPSVFSVNVTVNGVTQVIRFEETTD